MFRFGKNPHFTIQHVYLRITLQEKVKISTDMYVFDRNNKLHTFYEKFQE